MELSWFKKIKEKIKSFFKKEDKVPQGIQVFDENGKTVIDITDRLTQIVGVKTMTKLETSGQINVANNSNGKVWFSINMFGLQKNPYIMWVNGDTIHYTARQKEIDWINNANQGKNVFKIIYGVC